MAKTTKIPARNLPVKPGQQLLSKQQMLTTIGNPAYSTVWTWMCADQFPRPIELGPPDGRTTLIAWYASEVYEWLANRPRRQFGLHEFRGTPKPAVPVVETKPKPKRRPRTLGAPR
jgi:predicted DNA-binding transcriptional regulator AlpA